MGYHKKKYKIYHDINDSLAEGESSEITYRMFLDFNQDGQKQSEETSIFLRNDGYSNDGSDIGSLLDVLKTNLAPTLNINGYTATITEIENSADIVYFEAEISQPNSIIDDPSNPFEFEIIDSINTTIQFQTLESQYVYTVDTDSDGTPDATDLDDDNDGLLDTVEVAMGTNPLNADTDGDGFVDSGEALLGTDPTQASSTIYSGQPAQDSDSDAFSDFQEILYGSDPNDGGSTSQPVDSDGDQTNDVTESILGTDPNSSSSNISSLPDTDGDGLKDKIEEVFLSTNPLNEDTDGDSYSDSQELNSETNPIDASSFPSGGGNEDSDNDGLTDSLEEQYGTDPGNPDTDGDSYLDGDEVNQGTDPINPNSYPGSGGGGGETIGFLQFSTLTKATPITIIIAKSDLAALSEVTDPYFNDSVNIKSAIVTLKSTQGKQKKTIRFLFNENPTADVSGVTFSEKARSTFTISKLVLNDFDGGKLTIQGSDLISFTNTINLV